MRNTRDEIQLDLDFFLKMQQLIHILFNKVSHLIIYC